MRKRRGRPPGATVRHREIAAAIARRLAAGEWPVGTTLPSYRELARSYETGIQAVRLALKSLAADGQVLIRPRRPPQAMLGASLASTLRNSVAVVCTFGITGLLESPRGRALWHGIGRGLERSGCALIILQHASRWRSEFPAGLEKLPLRGAILIGPFRQLILRQYETMKTPIVLADQPADEFKFHSVAINNYKASFDATSRLIARGHRRLAFVRSLVNALPNIDPDSRERQAGFAAACLAAGIAEREYKIFSSQHNGSAALKELVRAQPRYTAVVCSAATHAAALAAAAAAAGLTVPRDISIVAFHPANSAPGNGPGPRTAGPMQRDWSGPRIDFELMGRTAADLLLQGGVKTKHVRMPMEWNEGDSIAPVRLKGC